jgi:hypothetical protein
MWKIPDYEYEVAKKLASADGAEYGWAAWALRLLPMFNYRRAADGSLEISASARETEFYAVWPAGGFARTGIRERGSIVERDEERSQLSGKPKMILLLNELLTRVSNTEEEYPSLAPEASLARPKVWGGVLRRAA